MSSNAGYDAFLSYNTQDRPAVEELAGSLRREELELYLEVCDLLPGREFQPGLAEALGVSKACVVFLGPNGLGPWQKQELQVAIAKRVRDPDFHVIPVLLPGAERPRRGAVAHLEFLLNASWVEFSKSTDDRSAIDRLVAGIKGIKRRPRSEEANRWGGRRPYRGLEAFGLDDATFFFGRHNLTDWLVSDLRREVRAPQGVRFLAVLGPSGSGKSSVVLAGLVPRLKQGAVAGSERWPIAVVRPEDDPLENLAIEVIARFLPEGAVPDIGRVQTLRDDLQGGERGLDRFARLALRHAPAEARLVVVVDQFEEVFTYRPEDEEVEARQRFERGRAAFFANLLHAATTPGGRVAVVLTMRSDFLGACASFPRLNDVLNAHLVQVGPMQEHELREAIEEPAFLVGCEPEPGLTERLLADVKGQAGALPLLQFALDELWNKREVRRLTKRAYHDLGGIQGALEHRANTIFGGFAPEEQDLCRCLFVRLVQPGEGTEDTRRRVSFRELLPDDPVRAEAVRRVIEKLANPEARLITTDGASASDGAVEVAHEALIRGWKQLRCWLDADRAGLRTQRRLTEAAQEWAAADPEKKDDYLYSGARLAVASEWTDTHGADLGKIERAFLSASREAERQHKQDNVEKEHRLREAAEAREEAERKRAEEAEARTQAERREREQAEGRERDQAEAARNASVAACRLRHLLRVLIGAMAATIVAAVIAALLWNGERQAQRSDADHLFYNYLVMARDRRLGNRIGQRFGSLRVLKKAARLVREQRWGAERLLSLRNEAIAALARFDVKPVPGEWGVYPSGSVGFCSAADLTVYARSDEQGTVTVRHWDGDREVARFHCPKLTPKSDTHVQLSADGRFLAILSAPPGVGSHGRLWAWDLSGAEPTRLLDKVDHVLLDSLTFSADGRQFAFGRTDGTVLIHDLANRKALQSLRFGEELGKLVFHPRRPLLAVVVGQSVMVYDLENGAFPTPLTHDTQVDSVTWHPDGNHLATVCGLKMYLWDVAKRKQVSFVEGFRQAGIQGTFNRAGDLLITHEWGSITRFWDARTGRQLLHTSNYLGDFFTADDRWLGPEVHGTKVRFYEAADRRCFRVLQRDLVLGPRTYAGSAISPDNRVLATAADDGIISWDLGSGAPLEFIRRPGKVYSLAFEPSGALLTHEDVGLMRWPAQKDPASPGRWSLGLSDPERLAPPPEYSEEFAASSDGRVLARYGPRDEITVWHRDRPGDPVRLKHDDGRHVAVSHDGRRVATGSHWYNDVKVWDAATGKKEFECRVVGGSRVGFSPDGRWLLTTGAGGRLWEVGPWSPRPLLVDLDPSRSGVLHDFAFAFAPDSRLIALETGEGSVVLVEVATRREVARLDNPDGVPLRTICFQPDGTLLAGSAEDQSVHVWDLRSIRRELRNIDLDWEQPDYPPAPEANSLPTKRVNRPKPGIAGLQ